MPVLATAIRRIRAATGYTQTTFGILAGVKWQTVSGWERGQSDPSDAHLRAIAAALSVDPIRMVHDALAAELADRPQN
jgi:DNA-binding transcriptional regulator YiaG